MPRDARMNFDYSPKVAELRLRLADFMDANVYPNEKAYFDAVDEGNTRWSIPVIMDEMKAKAKQAGLWNLFLPDSEFGAGLSNIEYAPLAEIMGRSLI
ncbi:MAG: acyl-CoA dehydrogenase, partial [Woeseiaceae bacterium]